VGISGYHMELDYDSMGQNHTVEVSYGLRTPIVLKVIGKVNEVIVL
jgi:hypothetical protein